VILRRPHHLRHDALSRQFLVAVALSLLRLSLRRRGDRRRLRPPRSCGAVYAGAGRAGDIGLWRGRSAARLSRLWRRGLAPEL